MKPTDASAYRDAIERASNAPALIRLKRKVGMTIGAGLRRVGQVLHVEGHIFGTGRIDGTSPRGNGDDELVAVGALLQIGELALPAVQLLSRRQHYAGAALVRQLVEVECLMWAFASNPTEARAWLSSTRRERETFFFDQPAFASGQTDYAHHCEMGGHPVPRSLSLIGGAGTHFVQLLVTDILLHKWRTMDSAVEWSAKKNMLDLVRAELEPARAMCHATRSSSEAAFNRTCFLCHSAFITLVPRRVV